MGKIKNIFWKYFVEKRLGKIRVFFKEPKLDDKLGMTLFGLIMFTRFLIFLTIVAILIYLLFIGRLFGGVDIVWPILIRVFYIFICISCVVIIFYYAHLRSYLYAVAYFVILILSFFVYYYLFMGGRI